jgi:hypothetical protein
LIDAGVNVGLPYNGMAPDLGWFESRTGTPGDYNADGKVDAADYVMWRSSVNTAAILPNDTTPGSVDDSDYDVWRANFTSPPASGAGSVNPAVVPEPVVLVELLVASLLLPTRRIRIPALRG